MRGGCEVWFRGVHSDVGGGNDNHALNDITLRWMLRKAIATFRPQFLAFTSKTAGQKFFDGTRDYGEQSELIGDTKVWILPSTSGAANGSWRPEIWHQFADKVRAAVS